MKNRNFNGFAFFRRHIIGPFDFHYEKGGSLNNYCRKNFSLKGKKRKCKLKYFNFFKKEEIL